MSTVVYLAVFVVTAIVLHVLHARIGRSHEKLLKPAVRVILEVAPSTVLARRLAQGAVRHPLAVPYRIIWYVHLLSGLAFAISLMVSAYFALR